MIMISLYLFLPDSDEDDYEDEYDYDDDMRMSMIMMTRRIIIMRMVLSAMLKNLLSATPLWSASSVESNCFPRSSTSSRLKSLEQDIVVCDPLLMLIWAGQSGVFRTTHVNLDSRNPAFPYFL